jgi:hypothetical protein
LAGKAANNNVGCSTLWTESADVIVNGNSGPIFGEDAPAERLALHELHGFDPA